MPNVNLTDSRNRDAVVKAETTGITEELRYVDGEGKSAYTRKILKATVAHEFSTLVETYDGNKEKLAQALIDGDPEVDIERCGVYLWGVSKVYVNTEDGIVYRIEQTEVVRDPSGNIKEKRPRSRAEANVDVEIPLTWTGRKIDKAEAVRRFVFSSQLQIVHINGLTYDFLFGMASELAAANSLMMIGGGSKGRDPLIFRSGSIPYRGFLEGRVDGERYILLLHLSNMELKAPPLVKKPPTTKSAEAPLSDATKLTEKKEKADTKTALEKSAEGRKSGDPTSLPKASAPASPKKKPVKKKTAGKSDKKEMSAAATERQIEKKKTQKKHPDKAAQEQALGPDEVESAEISAEHFGVWLRSVRMGKYLDLFVENEIDVDGLPEMTDDDFAALKIPPVSRRRLLKVVRGSNNLRAEVLLAVKALSEKNDS